MHDQLTDRDVLVTYDRADDERVTDGIFEAFEMVGYDLPSQPLLNEFVAPDAINRLRWNNQGLRLITWIWGHPVNITPEQVIIYQSPD